MEYNYFYSPVCPITITTRQHAMSLFTEIVSVFPKCGFA